MSRPRHFSKWLVGLVLVWTALGTGVLIANQGSSPTATALTTNMATSSHDLPASARSAMAGLIAITADDDGHLRTASALVGGDGHTAVTTLLLTDHDDLSASNALGRPLAVAVSGRDTSLGLTFLRLAQSQPTTAVAALPSATSVIAMVPNFAAHTNHPTWYWSSTTFGDPFALATSRTSTLAMKPATNFAGVVGAVAVNHSGRVVAIMSTTQNWIDATYVRRVTDAFTSAPHCHGRLGITTASAAGGGALVTAVDSTGPSALALRSGDIITQLNATSVADYESLVALLYATPGHHQATVTYLRGTATHVASLYLGCAL
jgi:S1-C subfamily serine protease